MKLINAIQHAEHNIIYHKPDSCLVRNNEAFYLPDFAEVFTARLAYVIRIKKIGKHISARFAHRYYDEVSVGLNIEAKDYLSKLQKQGLPWDAAVCFDYSAPIGIFQKKQEQSHIQLFVNNKPTQDITTEKLNTYQIVEDISHQYTLKIGDLIYISLASEDCHLAIGQKITARLNDTELLQCDIK